MIHRGLRASVGAMKELALLRLRRVPFPPVAPALGREGVFIGASNSAGQGWGWGRALERARADVRVISARFGGEDEQSGFDFDVDQLIYSRYAAHSASWRRKQFTTLRRYRAVLIESGDAILSRLFDGDVAAQAGALQSAGVRVALVFHGSDIRSPDSHMSTEAHSHFTIDPEFTDVFRKLTARNRELAAELRTTVFVSTPALLDEVPGSTWLPVVVDAGRWSGGLPVIRDNDAPLRVAHIPSSSLVKGTELIDPPLRTLAAEGTIEYRPMTSVPHLDMPDAYRAADVVVDQFRVGDYGVAACEAMASGRIVVSHVADRVRLRVRELTGEDLPIVEATPETLADVLRQIRQHPVEYRKIAAEGAAFVRRHHDGRLSGAVLSAWLNSPNTATR